MYLDSSRCKRTFLFLVKEWKVPCEEHTKGKIEAKVNLYMNLYLPSPFSTTLTSHPCQDPWPGYSINLLPYLKLMHTSSIIAVGFLIPYKMLLDL